MSDTTLVANRYAIGRLIGQGGMGEVFQGVDTTTQEPVAIKVLNPEIVTRNPLLLDRFKREGEALRKLAHPHIVKMQAAISEKDKHYLVMEYVPGGSLREMLDEHKRLPLRRALEIALDLADALTRAHRIRIIHRDIKPSNVLLAEDGSPRLTDFGIARMSDRTRVTEAGAVVGTFAYISPESFHGREADERADIWAFGVMLFEMLAGHRPFDGDNPMALMNAVVYQPPPDLRKVREDVSPELVTLILRMLAKDPDLRLHSIRHVGAELETLLHEMDHLDRSVSADQPAGVPSRFATPLPLRAENLPASGVPLDQVQERAETLIVPLFNTEDKPPPMTVEEALQYASGGGGVSAPSAVPDAAARHSPAWLAGGMALLLIVVLLGVIGVLLETRGSGDPADDRAAVPVEPTPLEGVPADLDAGESVVIVAQFDQRGYANVDAQSNLVTELEQAIAEAGGVIRVIAIDHPIADPAEARRVSNVYNAALVVYGNVSPGGAHTFFEITPRGAILDQDQVNLLHKDDVPDFSIRVSANDVPNFDAYVFEGLDAAYVAPLLLGVVFNAQWDGDNALRMLQQAEAMLDESRAEQLQAQLLYMLQADSHIDLFQHEEAMAAVNRALELDPELARAYFLRAFITIDWRNDYEGALDDLLMAQKLDPDDPLPYLWLGIVYDESRTLRDPQRAIAYYRQWIDIRDGDPSIELRIVTLERTLTPAPPTATFVPADDVLFAPGAEITIPAASLMGLGVFEEPGNKWGIVATYCVANTTATVLDAVTAPDGSVWLELECVGGQGWTPQSVFEE